MNYVILLRGVNAGGKRRVPSAEFKQVLESCGFHNVRIYINSGNAVAASDTTITASAVQAALENHFGFTIDTLVLTADDIQRIAAAIPDDWTNDALKPDKSGQKSDVGYLFPAYDNEKVLDVIGYRPDIETMHYVPGALIMNITRANQTKGSLAKCVGSDLYHHMTVRNVNTARKLAELASEPLL